MARKHYLILFIIGLLLRIFVGWLQNSPGFMDAEYYFIGAQSLAAGHGFSEQVLWNYLDDPAGLPHPSHAYWMPLTSILAAIGLIVGQSQSFASAQAVLILIGSLFPPLTAYLCYILSQNRDSAWLAGGLAILSAFYLPYMSTTDTFGIYAVLGGLFFVTLSIPFASRSTLPHFLLGIIAGLMHLSRADGIMWLGFAAIGSVFYLTRISFENSKWSRYFRGALLVFGGYLLTMGPWFLRNWVVFGSLLAPGGSRSLWITTYNELFIYPANQLTMERWLAAGFDAILRARFWALKINLQRSIAEQGMIFLTPLILLGLWQYRRDFRIKLGVLIWVSTFLAMTLVFPYQGARGGFFHSSAALLPLLWAMAPLGLNSILDWTHRTLEWKVREPRIVFSIAILVFVLFLTLFTTGTKFLSVDQKPPQWEQNRTSFQKTEAALQELGANLEDAVITINPPGYYAYTQRKAIAIPEGTVATVLQVADQFHGKYLILEADHPDGLAELYASPETSNQPRLKYLTSVDETHIFIIE